MRKLALTLVAATALGAAATASPAAGAPPEQACAGELISYAVGVAHDEGVIPAGRRGVAGFFTGDYPRAVQDLQGLMMNACGLGPDGG